MGSGKISILIAVYNEAATCGPLLDQVIASDCCALEKEIIVVESNSTDGTRAIIQDYEKRGKIRALYEDAPRGKGRALQTAIAACSGDIILIQDADLEYKISEYPLLIKPLVEGRTDFVLGSRHLGASDWQVRQFIKDQTRAQLINIGALFYTGLFNFLFGTALTDPATMFKVFRRSALQGITLRSNWFDLDWEIVAKLVRNKILPLEVPVSYASRSFADGKKIRFWRDAPLVLWAIVKFRFIS